jgi:hypothetical protein
MSMKNFSDNIGDRTRDLPACSAMPQPTALLRAPERKNKGNEFTRKQQQKMLPVTGEVA